MWKLIGISVSESIPPHLSAWNCSQMRQCMTQFIQLKQRQLANVLKPNALNVFDGWPWPHYVSTMSNQSGYIDKGHPPPSSRSEPITRGGWPLDLAQILDPQMSVSPLRSAILGVQKPQKFSPAAGRDSPPSWPDPEIDKGGVTLVDIPWSPRSWLDSISRQGSARDQILQVWVLFWESKAVYLSGLPFSSKLNYLHRKIAWLV